MSRLRTPSVRQAVKAVGEIQTRRGAVIDGAKMRAVLLARQQNHLTEGEALLALEELGCASKAAATLVGAFRPQAKRAAS